ncbi:MAG: leucyl aminopeptidase [Alphaproteobacteria bacterium]|nr:leucyl aminopeptidase [Alphaproteobacteria bacterium]
MKIGFAKLEIPSTGTYVVGVHEDRKLTSSATALDKRTRGMLSAAMAGSRFKGRKGEMLDILQPRGVKAHRVVLLGLGKPADLGSLRLQRLGGLVTAHLNRLGETTATVAIDAIADANPTAPTMAAQFAYGARLRSYRFDKYRTREKPEHKPTLRSLALAVEDQAAARKLFAPLSRVADGVHATRDVVSEPPNVIYPATFAERCKQLEELGVKVEVLDEKQMAKLGMGALLGVAQGSAKPPRIVVMQWSGAPDAADKRPIAFCGKGVTFDTGGISLKPAAGMEDMKWDMAGAGAVLGVMTALAGRKAKVNAVGVVGLVENMPDGNAQRPSDIVTSMSGRTIEVLNTDAEGRLVLADVCWYTQDRFKPKAMIDLATLTGAIIIALGHEFAGLFANNEDLAAGLLAAGRATGEKLWRMPLGDVFDRQIDSDAADVKNIAGDRAAGSTIGAVFIQRFVNDVPWAHLDIAGVAWSKKDHATTPKGATAFGVRLLDRLVADRYEEKRG